jgi:hypothetical protein
MEFGFLFYAISFLKNGFLTISTADGAPGFARGSDSAAKARPLTGLEGRPGRPRE